MTTRSRQTPCHGVFSSLSCGLLVACWLWAAAPVQAQAPAPDPQAGEAAYRQSCARCHGDEGRGDGVDATRFYPRPRDLTTGVYKFRTTVSGTPPTDQDLLRTITEGLPGSNMPDWKHLDEATRWQLVYYLKSLSPLFAQTAPEPVAVATDPGSSHADRAKGKLLYEQLGCAACHGSSGRASGTSAAGLVDDWGKPVRPADLTKGWSLRGSPDARAIMLRVLTGIDGAGMPSYAGAVSPEDAWQLAYYVASLQEPPHWNLVTHATRVTGTLPTASDDPRWVSAERTDVRLRQAVSPTGEWVYAPTVTSVAFQTLYNEEAVAFRIVWNDPTEDQGAAADRLALLLRPPGAQGDVVTLQAWPSAGAPALDLCTWSAQTGQVTEAVADDFHSVPQAHGEPVPLKGAAQYADGRWTLVVQRALRPSSPPGAALLTSEAFNAAAFAVWDGAVPEARAVSMWIDVVLQ